MIATQPAPATTSATRPARRPSWRRLFLVDFLNLEEATGVPGARWEYFQLDHLDDERSIFRIENKSRQIAWSWLTAAEAIADAAASAYTGTPPRDSIFVSIKQDEAAEKIRYAKRIYQTLLAAGADLPRLTTDNTLALGFSNGARLESLSATPPRGKARSNVYMDEFAHVRGDAEIYAAALPVISKGGRLRIGSSPFGAAGRFWEIITEAIRPYPDYTRRSTPWYHTYAFCIDPIAARRLAGSLDTATRIARYGNERIKAIFNNMPVDDFQQEYECAFVDETRSYFTWEEIRAATTPDLYCEAVTTRGAAVDNALAAIQRLEQQIARGNAETVLAAGYDVGRTRNTSELVIVGLSTTGSYPTRAILTLDETPYDAQRDVLIAALARLPLLRLWIDRNGIGSQIAEEIERHAPAVAMGQNFTVQSKQLWATTAKRLIQQRRAILPANRDLAYQIHSIRKLIGAGRQNIFDTEQNDKHHADKAWSLFLALSAADAGTGQADPAALATMFDWRG